MKTVTAFEIKRETTIVGENEEKIHELNRAETATIQEMTRNRRIALIRNNLILVAALNFLTVSGLICCLVHYEWFHFERTWIGLLYLYDEINENYYNTSHFISVHCDNQTNIIFCDIMNKFLLSGIICTSVLSTGLLFHLIYFGHIIFLALKRINDIEKFGIKIFKPLIFKLLSMICYVFALIFWAFYNKTYELEGKVGFALFAGIGACTIYLFLLIYYGILKKELKKGAIIDNLLNPDKFLEGY